MAYKFNPWGFGRVLKCLNFLQSLAFKTSILCSFIESLICINNQIELDQSRREFHCIHIQSRVGELKVTSTIVIVEKITVKWLWDSKRGSLLNIIKSSSICKGCQAPASLKVMNFQEQTWRVDVGQDLSNHYKSLAPFSLLSFKLIIYML